MFVLLATLGLATAQFPNLSNLIPGNTGGTVGNLDALKTLLGKFNGGAGAGATVDTSGKIDFSDVGKFFGGLTLPAGVDLTAVKASLSNFNVGQLGFKADVVQDNTAILSKFPGLSSLVSGHLQAKANTDINADLVTPNPFEIGARCRVFGGKALQTVNALILKANAGLDVDVKAAVAAGILQLEKSNEVIIKAQADVKAGLLLVNDAQSKIVGSFQIIGDNLAKIAATAKLQLGDALAQSGVDADVQAKILAKFDLAAGASLDFNGAATLLGGSKIQGAGDVNIKASVDFTAAADALAKIQADAGKSLITCKTLILDKLAELKLKASAAGQNILADIQGKLQFDGKIDIQLDANAQATIFKFLHSEAAGKAIFTVGGKTVTDITNNAAAGQADAKTKKRADEKVWTVTYGQKETTIEQKSASEIATTTTTTVGATDTLKKGSSSALSLAVAAVVAALAFMN